MLSKHLSCVRIVALLACCSSACAGMSEEDAGMTLSYLGQMSIDDLPRLAISAEDPLLGLQVQHPRGHKFELQRAWLITCDQREIPFELEYQYRWRKGTNARMRPQFPLPNKLCTTQLWIVATFSPIAGDRLPLSVTRSFTVHINPFIPDIPEILEPRQPVQ